MADAEEPPADRLSLIPRNRRQSNEEPEEEVQVTWFELFFDLVFVVAISKISAPLEEVETLFSGGTGVYTLRIICIWWVWHTATGCANVIRKGAPMWMMTFTTLALVCFAARACQRNDNRAFLYFYALARILNTGTYLWLLARGPGTLSAARFKAFRTVVLSGVPLAFAEAGLAFTAAALANGPDDSAALANGPEDPAALPKAATVPSSACIGCWVTLAAMWPALRTVVSQVKADASEESPESRPFDVSPLPAQPCPHAAPNCTRSRR